MTSIETPQRAPGFSSRHHPERGARRHTLFPKSDMDPEFCL